MHTNPTNTVLKTILFQAHIIALIGASSQPDKPSHSIMKRLQTVGYRVIPVNPNEHQILGEKAYPSLLAIPAEYVIDIVNVFRRPEYTLAIAKETATRGVKTLWLQTGIYNEEAARYGEEHEITVIMNNCIAVTHSLLMK